MQKYHYLKFNVSIIQIDHICTYFNKIELFFYLILLTCQWKTNAKQENKQWAHQFEQKSSQQHDANQIQVWFISFKTLNFNVFIAEKYNTSWDCDEAK